MNCHGFRKAPQLHSRVTKALPTILIGLSLLCLWLAGVWPVAAQSSANAVRPARKENAGRSSAEEELARRIAEAKSARESGDLPRVATANKRVAALALRELGHFRLLQGASGQAMELIGRSLDFEESSDARLELALSELALARADGAMSDAARVLQGDGKNALALTIMGRAQMQKREYARAAENLGRAMEIAPDVETGYSLGISLLSSAEADGKQRAARVFAQIVKMNGENASLHVLFGRAYRDAKDMPAAIREFEKAVAIDTKTPHAHYFLGLAQLSVNEWKPTPAVHAEFLRELQFHPRDYLANYMAGFLASSERSYAESNKYLKIAAEVSPEAPEPWLYLGLNAYAEEDMANAEKYFRKAVQLTGADEARSNYQIRRAYVSLGRILANSGRGEESAEFAAKARELQKKSMEQTQQEISAVITEGGGTMGAVVALKPDEAAESAALRAGGTDLFARLDPNVVAHSGLTTAQREALNAAEGRLRQILGLSFNDLATAEAVSGQYLAALGHYQDAERWDAAIAGLQRNIGLSAFRAGNMSETVRGLSAALAQDASDAPARAVLGSAYFSLEDYANAAKTIAPLRDRAMRDPIVGYAWAASLARLGDLKQASKILGEVEKLPLPPETRAMVGKLWVDVEDYERAVNAFETAWNADPKLPRVHYSEGLAYLRWQHVPEAIEQFNRQLQTTPNDGDTMNGLALALLEQGKRDEARKMFQAVTENHPENGNAQYQLGKLLLDDGNVKEAVLHLENAAKVMPQADYVHYQLQAAYRKDNRLEDADREMEIYKEVKARNRAATVPQAAASPQ
ncbi:MAG TPA: tetratricopeptide repeat protein [Candidatus Acidoferrum sp.]|nr:tetratricopeptide repeat protein [Candidatus Acidoferrum sp.]